MPEDPAGRPAGAAPEPPHEPIRALLERAGLPVPRRLGGDPAAGIELLEDVGSLPLQSAAAALAPAARADLYREACELVPRIQRIVPVADMHDPHVVALFERHRFQLAGNLRPHRHGLKRFRGPDDVDDDRHRLLDRDRRRHRHRSA